MNSQSWIAHFKIPQEQLMQWQNQCNPSLSLIHSVLLFEGLNETSYLEWAADQYQLPALRDEFFHGEHSQFFIQASQWLELNEIFKWREDFFPVANWNNTLFIACHEPQNIAVPCAVVYLLAPASQMKNLWHSFQPVEEDILPPVPQNILNFTSSDDVAESPLEVLTRVVNEDALPPIPLFSEPELPVTESPSESMTTSDSNAASDHESDSGSDSDGDSGSENQDESDSEVQGESHAPLDLSPTIDNIDLDFSKIFSLSAFESPTSPVQPLQEIVEEKAVRPVENLEKISDFQLPIQNEIIASKGEADTSALEMPKPTDLDFAVPAAEISVMTPHALPQNSPPQVAADPVMIEPISNDSFSAIPALEDSESRAWQLEDLTKVRPLRSPAAVNDQILDVTSLFTDNKSTACRVVNREEILAAYDDISTCLESDDILAASFKLMHQHYRASMFLAFSQKQLVPVRWTSGWGAKPGALPSSIDLQIPSPFRIAFTSGLPFHGAVAPSEYNQQFFDFWNEGQYPEHLSVMPIKIDRKLFGFILGIQQNDLLNVRYSLRFIEDLSERMSQGFMRVGVKKKVS